MLLGSIASRLWQLTEQKNIYRYIHIPPLHTHSLEINIKKIKKALFDIKLPLLNLFHIIYMDLIWPREEDRGYLPTPYKVFLQIK